MRIRLGLAGVLVLVASASAPLHPFAPSDAATSSRGSVPVGTASYPPPADAVFVSPSGSDSAAGTSAAPLRTVAAGMAKAPVGGTVVLRAGVYHEMVSSLQSVTVQNYPGEAVWFDGSSVVTGWKKSGTTWVKTGWSKKFSSNMGGDSAYKSRFVSSDHPMAANPDQVFLNGVQLTQVGSAAAVKSGMFYVDTSGKRLVIGSDPTGKEVRASDLNQAVKLSGDNSVLRGVGIRRYANGYEYKGAAQLRGDGGAVEDVVIQDVATVGLGVKGPNKTVNRVTINRAGMLGIAGDLNDNSVIQNSIATDNNTQGFKPEPVSGGMKFTSARTITVRNNEANSNGRSTGIWLDVSCYDATVVGNTASSNQKYGIEMEISSKGVIADNSTVGNKEAGIVLLDAADFQVFNNETGGSGSQGIKIAQDERRQSDSKYLEGRDPRYRDTVDPTVTWLTRNITVSNNVFGNQGSAGKSAYQLYGLDNRTGSPMDDWNVTVDGNLFNPKLTSSNPTMVGWGKSDNSSLELYQTPAALAAAKNPGWVNAQVPSSERIEDMAPEKATFASVAKPLPADVAEAVGQPLGAQALGRFPANPLTPVFTATPTGLSVAFDGSGSSDSDSTITSYSWDFGDGTTGSGPTPTHVYQAAGNLPVVMTVSDDAGRSASFRRVVPVTSTTNEPPTAAFTSVVTNASVAFDATGSTDDGTVTTYTWDFGDGTPVDSLGPKPTHTYSSAGDHTVTLTVTDDEGTESAPFSDQVTTTDAPPDSPPSASFTAVVTGASVAFDATGSTDDGAITTYAWDFGDGTPVDSTSGASPTHLYASAGDHTVVLTVTDDGGSTGTYADHVTSGAPPANEPPTAAFTSVVTDATVAFDAAGSSDDGTITSYSWSFGDATPTGSGVAPTHTYSAAGSYTVTLTVTDDDNATAVVSKGVTVTPPLAADTFQRTVANGWGSASPGGAWTLTGGNTRFNVSSGRGRMVLPASTALSADLAGVSSNATVVTASFAVDKIVDGTYISVAPRRVGTDYYNVRVRISADGTMVMNLLLDNATLIGSAYTVPGLKVVPGQQYTIKAEARGVGTTTVSGKVWKSGSTEPTAWQRSGTNTLAALQKAGRVGLIGKLPSNPPSGTVPVTLSWSGFRAQQSQP